MKKLLKNKKVWIGVAVVVTFRDAMLVGDPPLMRQHKANRIKPKKGRLFSPFLFLKSHFLIYKYSIWQTFP